MLYECTHKYWWNIMTKHFGTKYTFRLCLRPFEIPGYVQEHGALLGRPCGILNILILSSQSSWPRSLNHTFGFLKDRFERQGFDWQVLMGQRLHASTLGLSAHADPCHTFCQSWRAAWCISAARYVWVTVPPHGHHPSSKPKTTYYTLLLWSLDTFPLIKLGTTSAKWCFRYKHSHPSEAWHATYN